MKLIRMILIYVAGALSGVLLLAGAQQSMVRTGAHIGGEALILPLMILLIYAGWSFCEEFGGRRRAAGAYKKGVREGLRRAAVPVHFNTRCAFLPFEEERRK